MSAFRPISGNRSTSSYEEDDDDFSGYDPENAGVRSRGFSSLDATAYEARRAKCRRMTCCGLVLGLVGAFVAAVYYGYIKVFSPAWESDASNNNNYTPSYGSGEPGSEEPLAAGLPPTPVVDLIGLCDVEYMNLHGNKKCRDNCVLGACCFATVDNCKTLEGGDVSCNMYAPCQDVLDQPETTEPEGENYGYGGDDGYGYGDGDGGDDDAGYGYGPEEGTDDGYEYEILTNTTDDFTDPYYDPAKGSTEINIIGGDMPNGPDFGHAGGDAAQAVSICGNVDQGSGDQTCGDGLFCDSDDDCDPTGAFPYCLEGCGDDFMKDMQDVLDTIEEEMPNSLKQFCARVDDTGRVEACDADTECATDDECDDGSICSPECGAILYGDDESQDATGVCGIADPETPICDPDATPCFTDDDCLLYSSEEGKYGECLPECMAGGEGGTTYEYVDTLGGGDTEGGDEYGDDDMEGGPSGTMGSNGEVPVLPLYCATKAEDGTSVCVADKECTDDVSICDSDLGEACSRECSPEAGSGGSDVPSDMTDYYVPPPPEDGDGDDAVVDGDDGVVDGDDGVVDITSVNTTDIPTAYYDTTASPEDGPGGMPPVEGFEGDVPEPVMFCGRVKNNQELECTSSTCTADSDCKGQHTCQEGCGPTRF